MTEVRSQRSAKNSTNWMSKRITVFALGALLFALSFPVQAQQPTKVPRIGRLNATDRVSPFEKNRSAAFRQGLGDLGYVEGKNIVIEWRNGDGRRDRLKEHASELVRLKVDVIVTAGGTSTRAAKEATVTIPIVMTQDTDPVRNGFVASLARPGGNITGLSRLAPELSGKQLELVKEVVPRLSRVAVLGRSTQPADAEILRQIEGAARTLGLQLQYIDVRDPRDFETAFREASNGRAGAVLMLVGGPVFNPHRTGVIELAVSNRLPVIYRNREDVEAGGFMSYGVNLPDLDRRAATYVDKILKGAKPADLPVEQPTKFELVINLKTAKEIGLTIPQSMLYRADKVIK
jgi:putative ABC transport system substrate-binding protein